MIKVNLHTERCTKMTEKSMLILRGVGLLTLIGLGAYALSPKKNTRKSNDKARNNPKYKNQIKDEDIPKIKLLLAQGVTKGEIAEMLGIPSYKISEKLEEKGIGGVVASRDELIKEKVAEGLTVVEICLALNLEKDEVLKALRRLGVDSRSLGGSKKISDSLKPREMSLQKSSRFERSKDFKVLKEPLTYENMVPYLKKGLEACEIGEFFGVTEADVRSSIDEHILRMGPATNVQSIDSLVSAGSSQVAIALAKRVTLDELDAYYKEKGYPIPKRLTQAELFKINKLKATSKTNLEIANELGISMLRLLNFYEFFVPVPVEEIERMDLNRASDERVRTVFEKMFPYIEKNYEYFQIEEALGLSDGGAKIIIDKYIERHRDESLTRDFELADLEVFIRNGYSPAHMCILTGWYTKEFIAFCRRNNLSPPVSKKLTTRDLPDVRKMLLEGITRIKIAEHYDVSTHILNGYCDYFGLKKGSMIPRKPGNGDLAPAIELPKRLELPISEDQRLENAYGNTYVLFKLYRDGGSNNVKMLDLYQPPKKGWMGEDFLRREAEAGSSVREIASKSAVDIYEVIRLFVKYQIPMVDRF